MFTDVHDSEFSLHVRSSNSSCHKLTGAALFPGRVSAQLGTLIQYGHGYSLVVAKGLLYVAGGFVDDGTHNTLPAEGCEFFKYDPDRNQWSSLPPMLMEIGDCYPLLVEFDGYIYAVGSSSERYESCDARRYHIECRKWETIAPMIHNLNDISGVVYNGFLLVAGSCVQYAYEDYRSQLPTRGVNLYVFAFDPKKNAWNVAYQARVPNDCVPENIIRYIGQYPVQIFMHKGECYFQSIKYERDRYMAKVEEIILDCDDDSPSISLGEEVDQVKTFGALLGDEDVVTPGQFMIFDKRKMKLSLMQRCSLPHNKKRPFIKAQEMW